MADRVLKEHEIMLNGNLFPIDGFVTERLLPRFPPKQITGDYSYSNENILSNWIIASQKGGMLIDEMDEAVHAERYFWSTCDTRFRSNLILGPLATLISTFADGTVYWDTDSGSIDAGSWTNGANARDNDTGTYAEHADPGESTWSTYYTINAIGNCKISRLRAWVNATGSGNPSGLQIDLYYSGAWTNVVDVTNPATGSWLTYDIADQTGVSAVRIRLKRGVNLGVLRLYEVQFEVTPTTDGNVNYFVEFNAKQYIAKGYHLLVLDSGGASYTSLRSVPGSSGITGLVQNGTNLFILYNNNDYLYMNTSEAFTRAVPTTATTLGQKGIWWNDWLVQFDNDGDCKYSAAPAAAAPAYTANGKIPIAADELQEVFAYFDSNGDDIIYASTKVGLFAHDTANAKFLMTAVKVPSHPTAGKGAVVWQDAAFISAGLSVEKYIAGSPAIRQGMGLDKDDGMPLLRNGEIVKFFAGYNEFFALVDSTYEGTGSRSQVVSYDGRGWRTWWEATADNKNMYSGIVSSVYAYRLWFSTTDGVYYIPLQVTSLAPKRISGYTYGAAGIHISPRFDGGSKPFPKVATKLTVFLADASSTETVNIGYQIDASTAGAIATTAGWTMFAAQTTNGTRELSFASSVGVQYYDIQFRTGLVRAAGTTTLSPNVKSMVLSYYKATDKKLTWDFIINTAEAAEVGSSPAKLISAINTILTTNTLMTFTFYDGSKTADTHYVLVEPYAGRLPTGANWDGKISLTVIEP